MSYYSIYFKIYTKIQFAIFSKVIYMPFLKFECKLYSLDNTEILSNYPKYKE